MKKIICKIISLIVSVIVMAGAVFTIPSQAAENDFSMKPFDKAYVTFLFDDGRMPFTQECFDLFKKYNMPMCCDIVANRAGSNTDLFLQIQEAGGEIFSHTYSHNALTSMNSNIEYIEKELGDSFRILTGLGFNINGIIETGNGGGEKTANYELIETISRKYYKYSNAYGTSPQYNLDRTWLSGKSFDTVKGLVDQAISQNKWITLWAHEFSEFSKDDMDKLLSYINSKGKNKVEVVTWNYIYNKFGEYTGPQVPTVEAIESVCATQGHDLKNPVVEKEATCNDGPLIKGECTRCGKVGTTQSKDEALGHKFENYVSDNNADCRNYATKTAKCSNKGCNETDTKVDYKSEKKKHDFKTVTIKEATKTEDGLAEVKCLNCGYIEKTVVIPKGKDTENSVSSKPEKNDTSSKNTSSVKQNTSKNDTSSKNTSSVKEQNTNKNDVSSKNVSSVKQNTSKNDTSSKNASSVIEQNTNKNEASSKNVSSIEEQNTNHDDTSSEIENDVQEEQSENNVNSIPSNNKTSKKSSPIVVIYIVVSVLLFAATGVLVFFIIKIIRK